MHEHRTRSTLKRVAQALSVNEDVFLRADPRAMSSATARLEELELLRLFSAIADPEARWACLDCVRNFANSTDMVAG